MSTQTITEYVRREDGKLYRIEHTMVETVVDEEAERIAAINSIIAKLQDQIADLEREKISPTEATIAP